jgi:hypothetical protein
MRHVKGYVCIVTASTRLDFTVQLFFGPSSKPEKFPYENICSNGLVVFDNLSDAGVAKIRLSKDDPEPSVSLAKLEVNIFESVSNDPVENQKLCEQAFDGQSNFIVIMDCDQGFWRLIGSHEESMVEDAGLPDYPYLGLDLSRNGLRPIPTFEEAKEICWQRRRQSSYGLATIATFLLEKM